MPLVVPARTYTPPTPRSFLEDDPYSAELSDPEELTPIETKPETTEPPECWVRDEKEPLTGEQDKQPNFEPPVSLRWAEVSADSIPIQIWEGTVESVDYDASVMHVLLDAKWGQIPQHTADIELQWVPDQDLDLLRPGAVFYLTLFKRTNRGSIENSQELRFRRLPSWSRAQIKKIEEDAVSLLSKMKPLPFSE